MKGYYGTEFDKLHKESAPYYLRWYHTKPMVLTREDVIDAVGHYNAPLMPLYAVGCVAAIYVVCMLIDQLRIKLIEKPFFNLWDRHWDDFLAWYKKFETKVFAKMNVQE